MIHKIYKFDILGLPPSTMTHCQSIVEELRSLIDKYLLVC